MAEEVELSMAADDFFRTLPGINYPQALANHYPRIANVIAECRYDPIKMKDYLESLLHDRRPNRQGFPADVYQDIQNLWNVLIEQGYWSSTL